MTEELNTGQSQANMIARRCLQLFARVPVPGQVKTRLIPALGRQGAANLYRKLFERQLALISGFEQASPQLWLDGRAGDEWPGDFTGPVFMQEGSDLGFRMQHALASGLQAYASVVLIGCDCPGIDQGYLEQAFAGLEAGNEVVLGPARDGGYVLVGMRRMLPQVFTGIDWSSTQVLTQTRLKLEACGVSWLELATLQDIDEADDLVHLGPGFGQ